jgi:uncharacterized membrane protein
LLGLRAPTFDISNKKRWLIYPDDKYKEMLWDTVISIILLITCFVTPINLAFAEETDKVYWYVVFNYVIDVLFLFDIIINFNCAYQNEMYEMIDDRKVIAKNYLSGWFIIDVLAITPFGLIFKAFAGNPVD